MHADCGTCNDWGRVFFGVGCIDGADDIEAVHGTAVDGTCIGVPGRPGDGALVWGPWRSCRVESCVLLVFDGESIYVAVSGYGSNAAQDSEGAGGPHGGLGWG